MAKIKIWIKRTLDTKDGVIEVGIGGFHDIKGDAFSVAKERLLLYKQYRKELKNLVSEIISEDLSNLDIKELSEGAIENHSSDEILEAKVADENKISDENVQNFFKTLSERIQKRRN